jgi:hypothetical protein
MDRHLTGKWPGGAATPARGATIRSQGRILLPYVRWRIDHPRCEADTGRASRAQARIIEIGSTLNSRRIRYGRR